MGKGEYVKCNSDPPVGHHVLAEHCKGARKKKETITVYLRAYIDHLMQQHPTLIKSTPEKATARCKMRAFQFCYVHPEGS